MGSKFKVGDTVYWLDDEDYNFVDDPEAWIVRGKVVSVHSAIEGKGIDPSPIYTVSPADGGLAKDLSESDLFPNVDPVYDYCTWVALASDLGADQKCQVSIVQEYSGGENTDEKLLEKQGEEK